MLDSNVVITEPQEKAQLFVEYYKNKFNYSRPLQIIEFESKLEYAANKEVESNSVISRDELENVLTNTKNSAPGEDNIPYILLRNLSPKARVELLHIFNQCFTQGVFPDS